MRYRGFSLLELMVAITILGVMLAIGVPAFGALIDSQRMDSAVNSLARGLNYARAESVRRNRVVTVSPIDANWHAGWRIYLDRNNNGAYDDDETLLREDIPPAVSIVNANSSIAQYVRYNAQGETVLLNGGFQAGTFTFCPVKPSSAERKVVINRVGRVRTERGAVSGDACSG